jgi:recombination protein RecA
LTVAWKIDTKKKVPIMIPLTAEQNTAVDGNGRELVLKRVLKRPIEGALQKLRTLSSLIPEGRLSEVEGHGATSAIVRLVAEAQSQGEPVAWITGATSSVHPPDLAAGGIHLHSLAFLRIKDDAKQTTRLRAAELVLRSGAFALVVIEAPPAHDLPARALSRLHAMARRYNTRVVFRRCHHSKVSLGPLIGLKIHVAREIHGSQGERLSFRVQKNKARQPTSNAEMRFGLQMPDGIDPSQVENIPRVTSEGADVIPLLLEQHVLEQHVLEQHVLEQHVLGKNVQGKSQPAQNTSSNKPTSNPAQGDLFEAFRNEGTLQSSRAAVNGSSSKARLTSE